MKTSRKVSFFLPLICLALGTSVSASQKGTEIKLSEGTRISLRLNDYLSTKLNSDGDSFTADVTVPLYVGERLVIPKGSIVRGSITRILRPGRFRGKAVMNIVFHSIQIPGSGQFPIVASLASLEAEGNTGVKAEGTMEGEGSKGKDAVQVVKPATAGAGIGALAAGGRGSAIGSGVGAAVGLASVFLTRGKELEVRRGTSMDIVLDSPMLITLSEPRP